MMKLKLQDMTAESLSLATFQRTNRNTAGTFLNALEKVAIENKFLTHRGIFTTMMNGIQINNKTDSVIAEKVSKNVHVLTFGEKSENIIVITRCNGGGQFLFPVLIFNNVNK